MQQKTIWIVFLITGGIINLFNSCTTQKDGTIETNYLYKNLTSENVIIKFYDENGYLSDRDVIIAPNLDWKIQKTDIGPSNGIIPPYSVINKIVIYFPVSNKCVTYNTGSKIFDYHLYDNYEPSMNNNSNNTLIFNIDQEEITMSTTCN